MIRTTLLFLALATSHTAVAQSICDMDGDGALARVCGGADCDDSDPRRYPGAVEVCDAANVDEDCDMRTFGQRDTDGDGFVDATCCNGDPIAGDTCGDDCDDTDRSTHPNATEVCNDVDDNCNGATDEGLTQPFYADDDGDGWGSTLVGDFCPGTQTQLAPRTGDCDDTNPSIHPGEMVCGRALDETAPNDEVLVCEPDGSWWSTSCPNNRTRCYSQPNDTGSCEVKRRFIFQR